MRKHKIAIATLLLLIGIYLVPVLIVPPEAASLTKYNLTPSSARLLSLSFIIPLISVWSVALYGYIRLSSYAQSIRSNSDGTAFEALSHGVLALALWLPTYAVIQNVANTLWHRYPSITEGVIISANLLSVSILLFVSFLLRRGSRRLLEISSTTPSGLQYRHLYVTSAMFGALIGYLVIFNPTRGDIMANPAASYYLPAWLLIICIVIPYALVWYAGLEAVQNIATYRTRVKGIVYKLALKRLAYGIAISILSALTLRTLSTLTGWLDDLALKFLLLIIYALVVLFGIGYSLVWLGAKKLHLIEQV